MAGPRGSAGGTERAGAMHYIGSLVLILWLIVGAVAAGPLNYLGVDPEISPLGQG
jgi:hypothetical protein